MRYTNTQGKQEQSVGPTSAPTVSQGEVSEVSLKPLTCSPILTTSYVIFIFFYFFIFSENSACWYNISGLRGSSFNMSYRENVSALSVWYNRSRQWSVESDLLALLAIAARYFRGSQN